MIGDPGDARTLLGPCARDGGQGDWWGVKCKQCTGSHHDRIVGTIWCTCDCHGFNKLQMRACTPKL